MTPAEETMWHGYARLPDRAYRVVFDLMRCAIPKHVRAHWGLFRKSLGEEFEAEAVALACGVPPQEAEAALALLVQHGFVVHAPGSDTRFRWPDESGLAPVEGQA